MRAVLLLAVAATAGATEAFACVRVVRVQAGTPSAPVIVLPAGYQLNLAPDHSVAAPGEYHVFISGPSGTAHATITWPGIAIADAIVDDLHLPLGGTPANGSASCDIPVQHPTERDAWSTLDVFSYPSETDLLIRVEHNHPARRAGWYLENPWTPGTARAMNNWIFAARLVLRDWGIHHQVAAAGKGSFAILGYESVNPLHLDYPPHWHLIDYLPGESGSPVPHYYMNDVGALILNKVQVLDQQNVIPNQILGPGQAMVYTDPDGSTRMATEIRGDGGLDLGPAPGDWLYSIVAGANGDFITSASVLKNGLLFAVVAVADDVARGILTISVTLAQGGQQPDEVHYYDPLTGAPLSSPMVLAALPYGMDDPNALDTGGAASSSSGNHRCGMGSALALMASVLLLARRAPWMRVAALAIGSGAAAGWRAFSGRLGVR
jgi:hypothetical protein